MGRTNKTRTTLVLIGTLASMTLVNVGSASAAGGDWLQLPGGKGKISWQWSSNRANLDNVYKTAWDTQCNDQGIYTYIKVTNELSYSKEGPRVNDSCSGGETTVGPSNWRDVANIRRVTVVVCRDNAGWDECTSRDYYP
ncbi:MAG TPA: hypothetical protein VF821_16840 [Lentzea sp.]